MRSSIYLASLSTFGNTGNVVSPLLQRIQAFGHCLLQNSWKIVNQLKNSDIKELSVGRNSGNTAVSGLIGLVMWYFAIYLGRAALKEPESNGSQIRI